MLATATAQQPTRADTGMLRAHGLWPHSYALLVLVVATLALPPPGETCIVALYMWCAYVATGEKLMLPPSSGV
ncbi:hypothetical protein M441DRAFT_56663 [Trichoderma asperellum CBS 433.97]|uniref:Uncharacterized protein n=1 Tax=Trichoderma asperellum (strain ATCC 204424 / CBS 433.97 / NBRC 101777) TaxID=1042311 RepID=A0A2T3ZFU5_TRIA4|nr:hypothetical protein M441DRAFT_56663 [Trichoderma asperellum CBS 433.97]PTB43675.1 hypothetical protein M441DRAFT_56663 [Trichoderma asperellum CBS 433.97]